VPEAAAGAADWAAATAARRCQRAPDPTPPPGPVREHRGERRGVTRGAPRGRLESDRGRRPPTVAAGRPTKAAMETEGEWGDAAGSEEGAVKGSGVVANASRRHRTGNSKADGDDQEPADDRQ